jgi:hypothetical protein
VEVVHSTEASARLLHCGPLLLMPEDQQRLAGLQGLALVRVCMFTCSTDSCICDTWNGVPSAEETQESLSTRKLSSGAGGWSLGKARVDFGFKLDSCSVLLLTLSKFSN